MSNPTLKNSKVEIFNQRKSSTFDDDQTIITSNRTKQLPSKIQVKLPQTGANNQFHYKRLKVKPIFFQNSGANNQFDYKRLKVNYAENKENIPLALNTTNTNNSSNIAIPQNKGIADSGATGHFMLPGAPVINIRATKAPIKIVLPDGDTIQSTHECELDIPALPAKARIAHIVPGLAHTSLISIRVLCDAGCAVYYDEDECQVHYKKRLIWTGQREPTTKLWVFPLDQRKPSKNHPSTFHHQANSAYTMTNK